MDFKTAESLSSWDRLDMGNQSSMVVYLIQLPSGFIVDRNEIERIYSLGHPEIGRVKCRGGHLMILFEYVSE